MIFNISYIPESVVSGFLSGMASLSSQVDWNEVDIVCGALNAKLQTKNLSSGPSRCISFDGQIFTPCKFERHAGKSSRNWKSSIRCYGKPLSSFIEMYETLDGKKRCHFATNKLQFLDTGVNSSPPSSSPPPLDKAWQTYLIFHVP